MNKFYLESECLITGEQSKRTLTWKGFSYFLSLDTTNHLETKVEQGNHYEVHTHIFESRRGDYTYKIYFENGRMF